MDWNTSTPSGRSKMDITKVLDRLKAISCPSLFKFKRKNNTIYNYVITLNTSLTTKLILICALLSTYKELSGEEINCIHNEIPKIGINLITDYCWADGSFSVVGSPGWQSSYTGISSLQVDDGQKFHHKYYQWVYPSLYLQAAMFYLPKWIWQSIQDQRINKVLEGLLDKGVHLFEMPSDEQCRLVQLIADLLFIDVPFFHSVVFTELFCLFHIVFQIWATDVFLNGNFRHLGIIWLDHYRGLYTFEGDPLRRIFPRQVKCTISLFGPGGGLNSFDGICFLNANSMVEKIYLILWFWFHILLLLVSTILICRGLIFVSPHLRFRTFSWTGSRYFKRNYHALLESPGNWFLLYILSTRLSTSYFTDVLDTVISEHFDKRGKPLYNSVYGAKMKERPKNSVTQETSLSTNQKTANQENQENQNSNDWPDFNIIWPDD